MDVNSKILINGDLEITFVGSKCERVNLLKCSHSWMVSQILDELDNISLVDNNIFGDLSDKDQLTDIIDIENKSDDFELIESNVWVYNSPYNLFVDLINDGKVILTQRRKLI